MNYYETNRITKTKFISQTVNCSICFNSIYSYYKSILTTCNHSFHINCFNKLLINNNKLPCPLCRTNLLLLVNVESNINNNINNNINSNMDEVIRF